MASFSSRLPTFSRPAEAAALDEIDGQIEALQAQLAALKDRRKEVLAAAWRRGHLVRLNELQALLPDPSGSN